MPTLLRTASYLVASAIVLALSNSAGAAPSWDVDLGSSSLSIDADTFADNGASNPFFDADSPPVVTTFISNFVVGPDTFDLGVTVNPISRDQGGPPVFDTSASAVGVITIDGLGSNTLEIRWRANTLNDTFAGDGFDTLSTVLLQSIVYGVIDGVGPGTPVRVDYDWEYFGNAVPDHENINEDPENASGSSGFSDDQGNGPGNLFNVLFAEPGPVAGSNSGSGTLNLLTSNPTSELIIDLTGGSQARMRSPGVGTFQEDLAGSEFIGRLTLRLTQVPEPSCLAIIALSLFGICAHRRTRD